MLQEAIRMSDVGLTADVAGDPRRFELWLRKRKARVSYLLQVRERRNQGANSTL